LAGAALLVLGMQRFQLPYEDGRYFDPATAVVYYLEAAELFIGLGAALLLLGLASIVRRFF
jgi:hypothetical protein